MRPLVYGVDFLVFDFKPAADQSLGEDIVTHEEFVVFLQSIKRVCQTAGQEIGLPRRARRCIRRCIPGFHGINTVDDAVKTGHQNGGGAKVRVGRQIGWTVLNAAQLRVGHVTGNADGSPAVAAAERAHGGRFETRHQTLETVGARVGQGAESIGVFKQTTHVEHGSFGKIRVALFIVENILAVLHQKLVKVPAAARVVEHGLGHECDFQAVLLGKIEQDVLGQNSVVAGCAEIGEPAFNFLLALGPHFMMMVADGNTEIGHDTADFVTEIVVTIEGIAGVVGILVKVLTTAHTKGTVVGFGQVFRFFENMEFVFRTPLAQVGNAGIFHGLLGLAPHNTPVLVERGSVLISEAGFGKHSQGFTLAERIHIGRGKIRHENHVAVLNLEESVTGTIEPNTVSAEILGESVHGKTDVMEPTRKIKHLEVDELHTLFLGKLTNLGKFDIGHDPTSLLEATECRQSGRDGQTAATTRIFPLNIYSRKAMKKQRLLPKLSCPATIGGLLFRLADHHPLSKDALVSKDNVTIIFKGKPVACRADTSVGVALWENGIRQLSHSHKYGKPRGLTCARGHCTSCLMRVDGEPNVRTCQTPVRDGMVVDIQDAGAFYGPPMQKILSIGGNLFPVGFYYKWFTKPAVLSRFFLDQIRPLTGVGKLPDASAATAALPAGEEVENVPATELGNLGMLVIGAGPSGLAAALNSGGPVTIIDDHLEPGGQRAAALEALIAPDSAGIERFEILVAAYNRLKKLKEELATRSDIDFRGGVRAIAAYSPAGVLLRDEHNLWTASFDHLTWSAGALDSLGLFPGNDTPGVIGPRAAYRLLQRDGLNVEGKRVLVIGGGLDFWLTATLLESRGAVVSLVMTESGYQSEISAAVDRGWQLTTGLQLSNIKSHGSDALEATFVPRASTPGPAHSQLNIQAQFAVVCGRGKPTYDIPYMLGLDFSAQPDRGGYVPRGVQANRFDGTLEGGQSLLVCGEATGALPAEQAQDNKKASSS